MVCVGCGVSVGLATKCPACGRRFDGAPTLPEAKCALHPAEPSRMTCMRCGNFACAGCQSATHGWCAACAARSSAARDQVQAVAQRQKRVIAMFALGLLSLPAGLVTTALLGQGALANGVFLAVVVAVRCAMAWAVYRLADALGRGVPGLWAAGAFIPNIVGVVVLLVLSSRATAFLNAAGVKVGLLGAQQA